LFPAVGETASVPLSTPHVTNKQTTAIITYAQGIDISKQLFDDNMHGVWAADVQDFALKAKDTQDYTAFGLFRLGFTTALTADGDAIFSTHTLIGGGTQVNNGTSALSPTSLNTALVNLLEQKDQSGVIRGSAPAVLLVPPALWKHAREITDSALIADSGNNNVNVYRSALGITVWTSHWLGAAAGGSDTAWFLLARRHGFTRLVRQGLETALTDWRYSNNLTYRYQANFREAYFCSDYSGSYGSDGTVASS
jgi:phage major head subunit gpT-like protein